jgi:hypothetical protein
MNETLRESFADAHFAGTSNVRRGYMKVALMPRVIDASEVIAGFRGDHNRSLLCTAISIQLQDFVMVMPMATAIRGTTIQTANDEDTKTASSLDP